METLSLAHWNFDDDIMMLRFNINDVYHVALDREGVLDLLQKLSDKVDEIVLTGQPLVEERRWVINYDRDPDDYMDDEDEWWTVRVPDEKADPVQFVLRFDADIDRVWFESHVLEHPAPGWMVF